MSCFSNIKKTMLIFLFLSLSACVNTPAKLQLSITAAHFLNPDVKGQPAPIVVTILQLKSINKFNQMGYRDLVQNNNKLLRTDLLDKFSLEVRPDELKKINLKLFSNVKYIAIIAGFRKLNQTKWSTVLPVSSKQQQHKNIILQLNAFGLSAHWS